MPSATAAYSSTISMSPSPPLDIGSYSRFMHQHTKRQMEAISAPTQNGSSVASPSSSSPSSSNGGSIRRSNRSNGTSAVPSIPNGVASSSSRGSRSRSPPSSEFGYYRH